MEFLASLIDTVFRPLKDFFARTYGYIWCSGDYMDALSQEITEFKSRREDVRRLVDAAERQGMEATSQVKWWLDSVAALEELAARIISDYQEQMSLPEEERPGIIARYKLSKKADETMQEARNLKEKGAFSKVADELVQMPFEELPSVPLVGVDTLLDKLRTCLEDDDAGVVGIYGMAGVGKTAVLSKFNNEFLVGSGNLSVAIYIEVTREPDIDHIQRVIGDRLGLSLEKKTPKERAVVLYKVLSKMNFALLIDDLWEPLNLRLLGIPVPKPGSKSKIIISTRIEDVCHRMDVKRKIKVDCLSPEDAWDLFQEKVGEHLHHAQPELRTQAENLADKCGGLPLALITVGRAMASKRSTKEWKHANTVLKIAPWQLLGMENDLLLPLKSSYDNLPNDKLRLCLLYCSLFPERFSIYNEWIIGYCIGEGFIDDLYTDMDEIYNKGHDLLGDLKVASLIESGENEEHIQMHPMVRAMALWIASEFGKKETKWLVRAGLGLKEAPGSEYWSEAERVSLMRNNILELFEKPTCPLLKTLTLQGNPALEKICDGFFQHMPALRVLDLSHTSVTELPSGMSGLVSLQYLDLYHTNIRTLPRELGSLVNLRFLLLSNMFRLETIPSGVMCCLTMLQVLYMDFSYGDWKVGASGNGVEFQELENLRRIRALDITVQTMEALEQLTKSQRLAGSTRNLVIRGCSSLTKLDFHSTDLWKNMTDLKRIWIANCANAAEVIIDSEYTRTSAPSLSTGTSLHGRIGLTDNAAALLPSLNCVILQKLPKVNIIYKGGCLQQLTTLHIWLCAGIEQLVAFADEDDEADADGHEIDVFPCLKELALQWLPKFKQFSGSSRRPLAFRALEVLKVVDCPRLTKLMPNAPELKEIHGNVDWWNALEWDEEHVRTKYSEVFVPR